MNCEKNRDKEFIGSRYNNWEIISTSYNVCQSKSYFLCQCHCPVCEKEDETPTIKYVRYYYLLTGKSKQCIRGQGYDKMALNNPSTRKLNEYRVDGECAVGYIKCKKDIIEFKFDLEDYEIVSKYTWRVSKSNYIRTFVRIKKNKCEYILLHRLILKVNDKMTFVDHINHDTLDNRKQNLRLCTPSQNVINSKRCSSKDGSGVCLQDGKWMVRFRRNKTYYYGGSFDKYEDALCKRIEMEPKSEFNFIE